MSDEACLACHDARDMVLPLPSGEQLSLSVNRVDFKTSVHGQRGYACVQCHTDITGFPHPAFPVEDLRDVRIYMAQACTKCHEEPAEEYAQGAHFLAEKEGNKDAATCVDCHGAHTIREFSSLRTRIAQACQQCHADIYDVYKNSVHGKGLLEDFNPDVPSCIDCHDHHRNAGPTKNGFHLFSPQICAKCHADEDLMARYGINTEVFDTFVADFHGTTVTIFEKIAPDQQTNKALCIDCHTVHDIRAPNDTDSTVFKQNLLTTCQRCHPEATPNFPEAWLSHYPPDINNHVVVYLVNLFYAVLIPATLGIMGVFVATDFWRRKIRRAGAAHEVPEQREPPEHEAPDEHDVPESEPPEHEVPESRELPEHEAPDEYEEQTHG